jgi:hypothetical protein
MRVPRAVLAGIRERRDRLRRLTMLQRDRPSRRVHRHMLNRPAAAATGKNTDTARVPLEVIPHMKRAREIWSVFYALSKSTTGIIWLAALYSQRIVMACPHA